MGSDESAGGCEKAAVDSSTVVFPISTGVEVCSLTAGRSGSVLTKLCLFPGLQGSQGKPGSRGETNKKGTTVSHTHTHRTCSATHSSFLLNGVHFSSLGEEWQKETSFLETGPRDNKTAVVVSYVFLFFSLNAILSCCLW